MTRIYLVRHGENPANLLKQFSCRLVDYSLTPKGILQAEQTAAHFKHISIDAIYSSPLKRARETAEIIAREQQLPISIDEDFREINVGRLETEPPTAENWQLYFAIASGWFQQQQERAFPDGENYHQVVARMERGLLRIIENYPNGSVIVVAHGGIFATSITALCSNMSVARVVKSENHNCSISELVLTNRNGFPRGEALGWAECGHITGEAAEFEISTPPEHSAENRRLF